MSSLIQHFINGSRTAGHGSKRGDVFNPATGKVTAQLALGDTKDVDDAVAAARAAFPGWPKRRPSLALACSSAFAT